MKPAYRTLPNDWLTVAESAQLLGISKVSVYKALNCGRLDYRTIEGRKCIERQNLEARYWGSSQRFADRPQHGLAELAAAMPTDDELAAAMAPIDRWIEGQQQEANWDRIADRLNAYLGAWSPPPWDGQQANTLAMALALAQEAG
jgi:hypothetical protein